jgi:AraC-like DNA-binding protein
MRSRISISTDAVEPALRSDFWREISRPLFQVSLLESPEPTLRGACISQPVGDLMIGAIRFNRQRYQRDRKTISASGMDSYLIQCLTSGSLRGDCDGRTIEADVGDICIFDLARPYVTEAEAGARITIVIPRTRIDAVIGHRSLHGLTLRASDPLTQMLRSVLLSLNDIASDIDEADALAAETTLIEVLITIVSHRLLGADQPRTPTTTALRARVEAFLDAHLTSPDLGVEALMREFDVSRTHLYRIFADKGGLASAIRERRLDAAFHRLRRAEAIDISITDVALDLGFSSSAQFARAFRARFAMSPSEARFNADRPSSGNAVLSLQGHLRERLMELSRET